MRYFSPWHWLLVVLAAGSVGLCIASCFHLPYYTFMTTGKYDGVDVSLYRGSVCIAALRHSGIGVGAEPGWRWHHFINSTTPSDEVWLEYGRYLDEMRMLGWGAVYRVPLLLVTAFLLILPAVRMLRTRARSERGHCVKCGYNLTGNTSGACPECGEPFAESPDVIPS